MRKLIFLYLILLATSVFGQESSTEFNQKIKPIGTIYANYHQQIGDEETAFEIRRAYLGFKYLVSENWSSEIKLDIGSPDDLSEYSRIRRYAYFKSAALKYSKDNFTLNFGLIGLHQFKVTEKYWGHRYIYKTLQDKNKFGSSADIGLNAAYKFSKFVSADFTMINGEGYSSLQSDNKYKYGIGVNLTPVKPLIIRCYYDIANDEVSEQTATGFVGYKFKKKAVLGAEYVMKLNSGHKEDYTKSGYSVFGSYNLNKKWQLFARYDFVSSNKPNDSDLPWNLKKDGSAIISGIQFQPQKNVKFALNYQDWVPYAENTDGERFVYLNVQFKL